MRHLGLLGMLAGGFFAYLFGPGVYEATSTNDWKSVDAIVTRAEWKEFDDNSRRYFLSYKYTVDGKEQNSDRYSFDDSYPTMRAAAARDLKVGDTFQALYSQSNPSRAIVDPSFPWGCLVATIVSSAAFIAAVGALIHSFLGQDSTASEFTGSLSKDQ